MRDFKGMKRQRGRNRKSGGGGNNANATNPNRSWDSQGPENIKVRGNAQTVYERYQALARDAASAGDRVLAENYSQHAEHYFRVLRALQPQKSFQDIAQRETMSQGFDIDFEDESGAQAAAILAAQQAAERAQQPGQQPGQPMGQEGRQDSNRQEDGWRERSVDDRQDRDRGERNDREDGEGGRRETRRERWERRQEERRARFEREAAERDGREPSDDNDDARGTDEVHANEPQAQDAPDTPTEPVEDRPRRGRGRPRREATEDAAPTASEDSQALPGFLTRPTAIAEAAETEPKPRRRRTTKTEPKAE